MAVSVDEAIRESLRLFPNVPAVKEKQKKCIELLLKRKDVLGLLPLSRHPRGLGSSTLTLGEPDASLFTDEIRSSYKFRFKSDKNFWDKTSQILAPLCSSLWVAQKIGTELERFPVSNTRGSEQNLQVFPAVERLSYVFVGVLPGIVFNIASRTGRSSPLTET
ncbi:hypothetical protein P5673_014242 [Acropora cervicornis]|uniref:Uncharacterized protein n=1 Tax=Acropora cervicornis TaxID=6130 RepID=A0AAD9V603_ACRCE|nr:hypothetical protein P5673_014242 [Acropora cervicornis]